MDHNNLVFVPNFSTRCIKFSSTIKSLKFSEEGDQLAIGEENGNVNVISCDDLVSVKNKNIAEYASTPTISFKGHDQELDYLTSQEVTPGVENIEWLKRCNDSRLFLTSNKKAIKLWRIKESNKCIASGRYNLCRDTKSQLFKGKLNLPKIVPSMPLSRIYKKKTYKRLQHYGINSVSVTQDQKTFLVSDDLRINLYDLEIEDDCLNLVDYKTKLKLDDDFACLISMKAHTTKSFAFGYVLSNGEIRLADMRDRRNCDISAKVFPKIQPNTLYRQNVASHFDWAYGISFSNNGRYILARDIHTLKVWDINNEKEPLALYYVDENLTTSLHVVKDIDRLVDRLTCTWSGDDSHIITGCFGASFKAINCITSEETLIKADCNTGDGIVDYYSEKREFGGEQDLQCMELDCSETDFEGYKIGTVDWNKKRDIIATANMRNLIYYMQECDDDMDYSYKTAFDSENDVVQKFSEKLDKDDKDDGVISIDSLVSILNGSNISIRDSISTL
uniref:Serine/threonine-protein phosphatase 2A 55 kDa regulatory subunit B n=1 Tax=Strongyloides papillosus TaxID=174720 RepID=A0A0N5C0C0_STREA